MRGVDDEGPPVAEERSLALLGDRVVLEVGGHVDVDPRRGSLRETRVVRARQHRDRPHLGVEVARDTQPLRRRRQDSGRVRRERAQRGGSGQLAHPAGAGRAAR